MVIIIISNICHILLVYDKFSVIKKCIISLHDSTFNKIMIYFLYSHRVYVIIISTLLQMFIDY